MQHKHLFKKFFIPSLLFGLGIVIGFSFLFYINNLFQIRNIEVVGISQEDKKTITLLLKRKSTLTIQQLEIERIINTRFPTMKIKECRIQLPSTIILAAEKEQPFAYLQTDYGYFALSKSGEVIMRDRLLTIPSPVIHFNQIIHHSEYQVGQQIGFKVIEKALSFIEVLEAEGYEVETVAIDSVDMIACKTKGFEVAFSQSRPSDLQLHEVRQIIRQIKAGALRIERLDLRFDKPVVQLPQKNEQ